MARLLIFAGTTEGRRLAEALSRASQVHGGTGEAAGQWPHEVVVHVATDYGLEVLPKRLPGILAEAGRLTLAQMTQYMQAQRFDLVVDTTHPYAAEASENIRSACQATQTRYLRLLRQGVSGDVEQSAAVEEVCSVQAAAEYLNQMPGTALITTGSKELEAFTQVRGWKERLFVRVLPTASVVEKCQRLGFAGRQLICMQGPFSYEMNRALLLQTGADCLVTKDSGQPGGFAEKYRAAIELGVKLIIIGRASREQGLSYEEVCAELWQSFGIDCGGDTVPTVETLLPGDVRNGAKVTGSAAKDTCHDKDAEKTPHDNDSKKQPSSGRRMPAEPYFPLFINIKDRLAVVVGAGTVGMRRLRSLGGFPCRLRLVAKELPEGYSQERFAAEINGMCGHSASGGRSFELLQREFLPEDIEGAALVVAATDDRQVNQWIAALCRAQGIPVSVADSPAECSFFFPGIARKGPLVAGVTASGTDHRLARVLTEKIQGVVSAAAPADAAPVKEQQSVCAERRFTCTEGQ